MKSEIGDLRVPYYVMFLDEKKKLLEKMADDAERNFSPGNARGFDKRIDGLMNQTRSVAQLVLEAKKRLERSTGYAFRDL